MKRMRRAIHFDFHTMPGIYDFGERFDSSILSTNIFPLYSIWLLTHFSKVDFPLPFLPINTVRLFVLSLQLTFSRSFFSPIFTDTLSNVSIFFPPTKQYQKIRRPHKAHQYPHGNFRRCKKRTSEHIG